MISELLKAIKEGNLAEVKRLYQDGVNITAENNEALIWAVYKGYLNIIKFLIEHGADVTA